MSIDLSPLTSISGFVAASLVDSTSGMSMGDAGSTTINLELAAAGNTEVVNSKRRVVEALALGDSIEDILITLGKQYHLIRPLAQKDALFLYLVLDRSNSNLAMARHQLREYETSLKF